MARISGPSRRQCSIVQRQPQVAPVRIGFFNEIELPAALPLLEQSLAPYGVVNVLVRLIPNKKLDPIFLRKAVDQSFAMFPGAPADIVQHADVECAVPRAR